MADDAVERWKEFVFSKDESILQNLLHPDIVFESPIVHTPQRGREITLKYLLAAKTVLGGQSFAFVDEWRNQRGAALEFSTEVDGIRVNGVDIIGLGADRAVIKSFKVMIRPFKAIEVVQRRMFAELADVRLAS